MNIKIRPVNADDLVIQAAVEELKGLISKRFPTAQFRSMRETIPTAST
jgi:hypothetical protein